MSTLTIHDLDTDLEDSLRDRAARNGRSVEAEARAILAGALERQRDEPNLAESIRRRFAPLGGVELEPHPPVMPSAPPKLGR
ncbi:FitA-like ribbon-helix-helix domain-containing protein [Methylobacterium symbioticum]|jgi:plasmid stability protein|uniref:Antitoxin FitA-like ribbon-helix-helix domain-containing protein n=1 Tax=Methylobacterium symbioticum TaxID=2584084 RepID=A0A509ENS8_9HYPH|nr:plasmid stabilization protein [Methylobacterium symbioticum]VUD75025.1 hypothetical protein MET9862_05662 [Methylobacterium symbioticum]